MRQLRHFNLFCFIVCPFFVTVFAVSVRADDALDALLKKYAKPSSEAPIVHESEPAKEVVSTKAPEPAPAPAMVEAKVETEQKAPEHPKEKRAPASEKVAIPKAKPNDVQYTLQVGAFPTETEATHKTAELAAKGMKTFVTKGEVKGKTWYRANVEHFAWVAEAKAFHEQHHDKLGASVFVSVIKKSEETPVESKVEVVKAGPPVEPSEPAKREVAEEAKPAAASSEEDEELGLFGNWGGAKSYLADHGVEVELAYKGDYVSNMSGGTKKDSGYLGNADIKAAFDLEKIVKAKGLRLSLYAIGDHGDDPTEFVGDTFATSNIEAPDAFKLFEAYFEKKWDDRFKMSAGLRDLNALYYSTESSGFFINSAFGISPSLSQTGYNGPSIFPTSALSINAEYESPNGFYFKTGAFNGRAGDTDHLSNTQITTSTNEGYLMIWESGHLKSEDGNSHQCALGAWAYTKPTDRNDGAGTDDNWGFYALFDRSLTSKISVFLKYGIAQDTVNQWKAAAELGANFSGLIPSREDDRLGVGLATAQASQDYIDASGTESSETVYELGYEISIMQGLSIMPDYQYIQNPSLDSSVKDASVATLRVNIEF